jgi:hypothetical protein
MGHQVNFFVLPEDLPAIEAAIRTTGDVCFLEDRTATPAPAQVATLAFSPGEMGHRPLRAYIARRSDLGAVKMRYIRQQDHWIIDSADSPVVEFDRCFFDGAILRRGRAYFASDLRFRPRLPDADFVRWGDRVMTRVRKLLMRAPGIDGLSYFSAGALQWIGQDGVTGSDGGLAFLTAEPDH